MTDPDLKAVRDGLLVCLNVGAEPTFHVERAAKQALQALSRIEQGMGWRPIAEAPRDGTQIIVWDGMEQSMAWFSEHDKAWHVCGDGQSMFDIRDEYVNVYPTHWKPLPPPPGSEIHSINLQEHLEGETQ